jgi:hypothetical protein
MDTGNGILLKDGGWKGDYLCTKCEAFLIDISE